MKLLDLVFNDQSRKWNVVYLANQKLNIEFDRKKEGALFIAGIKIINRMEKYWTPKNDDLWSQQDFINNIQALGRSASSIDTILERAATETKAKLNIFLKKFKYKLLIELDFDIESFL